MPYFFAIFGEYKVYCRYLIIFGWKHIPSVDFCTFSVDT